MSGWMYTPPNSVRMIEPVGQASRQPATSVQGTHSIFLVRGDERDYNLPAKPEVPATALKPAWSSAAAAAGVMALAALVAFRLSK
jgi:hypothetical protein